ncbi:MAG: hypothetical protein AAFY10_09030 [Pseudomonadota bacterium]
MTWVFLSFGAQNPDETWFLNEVSQGTLAQTFYRGAYLGYGQIFWLGLDLLGSPLAARLAMLLMYLAVPWVLAWGARPETRPYVIAAWLALPAAWWTGKLVSPEIPCLLASSFAVSLAFRGRLPAAGLAFGIAVGIKALAAPLAILFPILAWQNRNLSGFSKAVLAGILGFVLSNPLLLRDPGRVLGRIIGAGKSDAWDFDRIAQIFGRGDLGWDLVSWGGFGYYAMSVFLLAGLLVLFCVARVPWRHIVLLASVLIFFTAAFLTNSIFFGWYWFPFLAVLLGVLGQAEKPGISLAIGLGAIGALNASTILSDLGRKAEQIAVVRDVDRIGPCLRAELSMERVIHVRDQGEFGEVLAPFIDAPRSNFLGDGTPPSHVLIGDRIRQSRFNALAKDELDLTKVARCGPISVYRVQSQAHSAQAPAP